MRRLRRSLLLLITTCTQPWGQRWSITKKTPQALQYMPSQKNMRTRERFWPKRKINKTLTHLSTLHFAFEITEIVGTAFIMYSDRSSINDSYLLYSVCEAIQSAIGCTVRYILAVYWGTERLTDVLDLIKFTYLRRENLKRKQIEKQMKSRSVEAYKTGISIIRLHSGYKQKKNKTIYFLFIRFLCLLITISFLVI